MKAMMGVGLMLTLVFATACNEEDDDGSNIDALFNKMRSCGIITEGRIPNLNSNVSIDEESECVFQCYLNASCDELSTLMCSWMLEEGLEACFNACFPNNFVCGSGEEIPEYLRCDGFESCADGSDEVGCPAPPMFVCGDGEEILEYWQCDGEEDCTDGSDEVGCPTFHCSDGQNILAFRECDGEEDCADGSDEAGCAEFVCPMFTCDNGIEIPEGWRCDGEDDCFDGSDEAGCD